MGSIGSPQRLEFTATGNTVNIASRIEGLTKTTGRSLLVTAAVRDRSDDSFSFEELPPQEVRGIDGRLAVFAVRAWSSKSQSSNPKTLPAGASSKSQKPNPK